MCGRKQEQNNRKSSKSTESIQQGSETPKASIQRNRGVLMIILGYISTKFHKMKEV
jgi:hypothetical protein